MINAQQNNKLLLLIFFLCFSCNQTLHNKKIQKNNFKNFYEKIDSIKIQNKIIYIEKFYSKRNIDYMINISNTKKYKIPFYYDIQPSDFSIKFINNNMFNVGFFLGNATLYNYTIIIEKDEVLKISKINFEYYFNHSEKIEKDSIFINQYLSKIKPSDSLKIVNFINKN